jgi:hypothetical protein
VLQGGRAMRKEEAPGAHDGCLCRSKRENGGSWRTAQHATMDGDGGGGGPVGDRHMREGLEASGACRGAAACVERLKGGPVERGSRVCGTR